MVMGIFRQKPKVTSRSSVSLTETGKKEAEQYSSKGKKFAILSALVEHSPQTIKELSIETQIEQHELIAWVQVLSNQGCVRFTGVEA